jgi:hypothetical protein
VFNGTSATGSAAGADIGIIAAGIAIPIALLALCAAAAAAAALLLWRRRRAAEAGASGSPVEPSSPTEIISPLYSQPAQTHQNELYTGTPEEGGDAGAGDGGAMTWDSI